MKRILLLILLLFVVAPTSALGESFTVEDVQIDVFLQENGDVQVEETYIYDFKGHYNGMTREIFVKPHVRLTDVKAFESGRALQVEQKGQQFLIHRKAEDEKVTYKMMYTLLNAVELYDDGAQFDWSFFDRNNETDFNNVVIKITPPTTATKMEFLGLDYAYGKGFVDWSGTTVFELGYIPAHEIVTTRVVYNRDLFSGGEQFSGLAYVQLQEDQDTLKMQGVRERQKRKTATNLGVIGLFLGFLFTGEFWRRKLKYKKQLKADVLRKELLTTSMIPQTATEMPSVLCFLLGMQMNSNSIAAALLDLVRKGNVVQHDDKTFELVNRSVDYNYELTLISFLFDEVGNEEIFTIEDLKRYLKNKKNHQKYAKEIATWKAEVKGRTEEKDWFTNQAGSATLLFLLSLLSVSAAVYFGVLHLYWLMGFSIFLFVVSLFSGFFYTQITKEGVIVKEEWRQFSSQLDEMGIEDWKELSLNDKYTFLIYSVGMGVKGFTEKYDAFRRADNVVDSSDSFMYWNHSVLMSEFKVASTDVAATTSSSSSSSGGGSGGSGGGAGAF